jgi:hypothetical protein
MYTRSPQAKRLGQRNATHVNWKSWSKDQEERSKNSLSSSNIKPTLLLWLRSFDLAIPASSSSNDCGHTLAVRRAVLNMVNNVVQLYCDLGTHIHVTMIVKSRGLAPSLRSALPDDTNSCLAVSIDDVDGLA